MPSPIIYLERAFSYMLPYPEVVVRMEIILGPDGYPPQMHALMISHMLMDAVNFRIIVDEPPPNAPQFEESWNNLTSVLDDIYKVMELSVAQSELPDGELKDHRATWATILLPANFQQIVAIPKWSVQGSPVIVMTHLPNGTGFELGVPSIVVTSFAPIEGVPDAKP